jgi:hypothetical protein
LQKSNKTFNHCGSHKRLAKLKQNISSPWKFRTYIKYKKIKNLEIHILKETRYKIGVLVYYTMHIKKTTKKIK